MDNQNFNPADDSNDMPPELPQRGGGTRTEKPATDRITQNASQLNTDPKGWLQSLPLWRKVCLSIFAVCLTLSIGGYLVEAFDGSPSDDAIRGAINNTAVTTSYQVVDYEITNSYVKKIDDEDGHIIEYKAHMHIKPELEQYVGSQGGISYRSADINLTGRTILFKRGNSWYSVNDR
jgi:hypothetical protein